MKNIAVLVPLRDGAEHIASFLSAMQALDYPKERIKLVFCEGDSSDGSWEVLKAAVEPLRAVFRDIVLLQMQVGTKFERRKRAKPRLQRKRARRPGQGAQPSYKARARRQRRLGVVDRHRRLEICARHRAHADRDRRADRRSELRSGS